MKDMRINWNVRIKNKLFWTAIISALLIAAQAILHTVGIEWDFGELGNNLIKVVDAVFGVLAILGIVICGFSYSLLRWYTGSIWITMGIHTMWNFTQNFIFGLPNSGLVSEVSVFNLDAVNAVSNLIYNYEFGVEAAIPALVVDALIGVVCIILAKRNGRLGELNMSYEKIAAAKAAENSMAETAPEAAPETV